MGRAARWDQAFDTRGLLSVPLHAAPVHERHGRGGQRDDRRVARGRRRRRAAADLRPRARRHRRRSGSSARTPTARATTLPGTAPGRRRAPTPSPPTAIEGARYRVTHAAGRLARDRAEGLRARRGASVGPPPRPQAASSRRTRCRAAPGLVATLQLYDRWHYRWRGKQTVKLDAEGMASFTLPGSTRTFARVALRRKKGAAVLAYSGVVRTRNGKPARRPGHDQARPRRRPRAGGEEPAHPAGTAGTEARGQASSQAARTAAACPASIHSSQRPEAERAGVVEAVRAAAAELEHPQPARRRRARRRSGAAASPARPRSPGTCGAGRAPARAPRGARASGRCSGRGSARSRPARPSRSAARAPRRGGYAARATTISHSLATE